MDNENNKVNWNLDNLDLGQAIAPAWNFDNLDMSGNNSMHGILMVLTYKFKMKLLQAF